MFTVWSPSLFSDGSLVVRNIYETIEHGKRWNFVLEVLWCGQALELGNQKIERTRVEGKSTENFTIVPVDAGYQLEYRAHIVSDNDGTDIVWSATLARYAPEIPLMPYLGMWQVNESKYKHASTAAERNKRQLERQRLYDMVITYVSVITILIVIIGIVRLFFFSKG